jgi:hypothetical protein
MANTIFTSMQDRPFPGSFAEDGVTQRERLSNASLVVDAQEDSVPQLTDPDRLAAYKDALRNWAVGGYIQFELTEQAGGWVRNELGIKEKDIGRLMHEFVAGGGAIDEVRESRAEWCGHWEFHHDLRFTIHDMAVYIETRLKFRLPVKDDESWILVVNIHER